MSKLTDFMEGFKKRFIVTKKESSWLCRSSMFSDRISIALYRYIPHYFLLDVEGLKIGMLQSFPFNAIAVDMFVVQYVVNECEGTLL